jgi:hypothetical protein
MKYSPECRTVRVHSARVSPPLETGAAPENSSLPASWASASERRTCGSASAFDSGAGDALRSSRQRISPALAGSFMLAPSQPAGANSAVSRSGDACQMTSDASACVSRPL